MNPQRNSDPNGPRIWRSPPVVSTSRIVAPPASYLRSKSLMVAPVGRAAPRPVLPSDMPVPPAKIYRPGDPAIRVYSAEGMPAADNEELLGAIVKLSGVRDGEQEHLLHDISSARLRSFKRLDTENESLTFVFARRESAKAYRAVLGSLRYVNYAPQPSPGPRLVTVQLVHRGGAVQQAGRFEFVVTGAAVPRRTAAAWQRRATSRSAILGTDGGLMGFLSDAEDYSAYWWSNPLLAPAMRLSGGAKRGN